MGDFYKYYTGELVAPILTVCVGGNHEAVGYLHELRYGGWLAPNIYFLGSSGVVKVGNLRVGGISGIFNPRNYDAGYENPPFNDPKL
jgi:lariat debranching enzyme